MPLRLPIFPPARRRLGIIGSLFRHGMLQNRVVGKGLSANGAIGKNIFFDVHAVFSPYFPSDANIPRRDM